MPSKSRSQEKGMSFIYLGIQNTSRQKELVSVYLFVDYNHHLVIHKMLLTVGFKTHPHKKIH